MNRTAVLHGVGIGITTALTGLFSALSANIIVMIIIPVIVAAVCSYADQKFSLLGYVLGFLCAGLLFSLLLNAINPGIEYYLFYYVIIFANSLLPAIFLGNGLPSKRGTTTAGPAAQKTSVEVPPIHVPEGVDVRMKQPPDARTGAKDSKLDELDKESSLTYLCPYCNAEIQLSDTKCGTCGADIDRRVTKIN